MSKFQIIIIAVFVIVGVIAVLIFAGILPGFKKEGGGAGEEISLWGIFSQEKLAPLLSELNETNNDLFKINYSEKKSPGYENELLNALAAGAGPDLWFLTQDAVLKNKDKVYILPFESYNERTFRDTFIDSAELLIDVNPPAGGGIIGFPLAVDPLILYWNRDLFSSAGIAKPPQYWDEFLTNVQILVKKDEAGNVIQAGTAMGEFRNVKNAKDIVSMLILQTGNPIIKSGTLEVFLGKRGETLLDPVESSIRFFNEFSNPKKASYTWNRALPDSSIAFTNGSLAMYFGYASEIESIREKNPHLNFDISEAPQIRDGKIKATFGKIYSAVISKSSLKKQPAFWAFAKLTDKDFSKSFSEAMGLGSSRRDVLGGGAKDPLLSVIYKSSIMSRTWLEPDPEAVYEIFKNMIESTATGRARISEAVGAAKVQLEELLKK
ncbi:MAG: extracellular solute-binding protein [Candidatus Terrybacteria bacterium]|nr:extracellular solute-binding protein [Candidatus Terrybacteria bacterium]